VAYEDGRTDGRAGEDNPASERRDGMYTLYSTVNNEWTEETPKKTKANETGKQTQLSLWINQEVVYNHTCDISCRGGLTDVMMTKMMIVRINCLKINSR